MTTLKDFQIISKLGEGAYSSVYKVKRLTDSQEYALKKVKLENLSEKEKQNALNEVRILASIKHSNIIAYKEAFIEENSNSLCIVMEYANNGDLYQKICEHQKKGTNFQEPEVWSLFIQMTKAVKALHDFKIFHRDLKSANIFLTKDGTVKLGDLNVSKIAKKGLLYTQTGTPYYASPEVWRDMPYDTKSDVWSLGCVLYEIVTLKPPFRAEDMEGLYKKVLKGYYPRIPTHYSQDLSNVIRALLQVSPTLRPSCDKVLLLPAVTKRMEEKHMTEPEEDQISLLNTIRIPKNLHFLTDRLPKANYAPLKTRKVEKNKFLQTLAGYKDLSNNVIMEESIRGAESVDSHKKDKDNSRVYLPPVGKEAQGKDIMKIYGGGREKKEHISKLRANNASRNSLAEEKNLDDGEYDALSVRKNKQPKRKVKNYDDDDDEREEVERGREKVAKHSNGAPHRVYKAADVNQEYGGEHKSSHVGKSNAKLLAESKAKDPIHLMIKRHKEQVRELAASPEFEDHDLLPKKQSKLPSLVNDKYGKLPPLNGEKNADNVSNLKKHRVKELSKAYKVNMENIDDVSDRYSGVSKISKKEKSLHNVLKHPLNHGINPLDYGINGVKYGKGYE